VATGKVWSPCRVSSFTQPKSPSASGSSPATRRMAASGTGAAKRSFWLVYAAKGLMIGVLMAVAGNFLAVVTGTAPLPWILTGILTGVIILASGRLLSARTIAGARTLAKVAPRLLPSRRLPSKGELEFVNR